MIGSISKETFETEARKNFIELSSLVQEYEQGEQESDLAEFAKYDPLKNIILGLAAKLRSKQPDLSTDESLKLADELAREAEEEIKKTNAKKRICDSLKSGSKDAFNFAPSVLPLLIELIESGVIAISFDPTGTILVSVACLIIIKMGIEGFCAE
ncbi:MAG: hypothetical protein AAF349_02025 [Cyanobacteria bacterium P01_A01_bin.68]